MTWKLYEGDHLDIMPKYIKEESIDLTVTSPPYDNVREYKGYTFNYKACAKELWRVTKPGGVVVWVVGDATINGSETGTSFRQALYFRDECGFNLHDTMIYEKDGISFPDASRYYSCFEYMFVFSKGYPKTKNLIKDRVNLYAGNKCVSTDREADGSIRHSHGRISGKRYSDVGVRKNVWKINMGFNKSTKDKIAYEHPAIFPENLAHDHIISWSNPGDVVFDPMAGSGTVLKVAEQLGRDSIGIEISGEYCDIIRKRMSSFQTTIFSLGGIDP